MKQVSAMKWTWKGKLATFLNKSVLSKKGAVLCPINKHIRNRPQLIYEYNDYVLLSSLEMAARQIYEKNVKGNIAELGVFEGEFAKYINAFFPDRKLYLFDTFEGFNKDDVARDKEVLKATHFDDFSDTNVETVLQKMPHKENCIVKKGFFPDTAAGLEDTFAFVRLDADLYKPLYAGLQYFYPKLNKGGYIFVHDYEHTRYPGAKEAVTQYCSENEIPYFVLSDMAGSAVICK